MSRLSVSLVLAIALIFPSSSLQAQSFRCPDGTMSRPATEAEANADGGGAGIIAGVTQHCPSVGAAAGITADAGRAKDYLKTKLTGAAAARGESSVTQMNGTFACRLADFIRASEAAQHNIRIWSGWRGEDAQARSASQAAANGRPQYACQAGANCPHPQGRAADLTFGGITPKTTAACNANPACRWAHANAAQFNLVFPLSGNPLEPWHIEPAERSGVPTSGPCGGGGGAPSPYSAAAPFGAGNQLRQALGMQQQPMPSMSATPSQPLQQQQSPLSAFNSAPIQTTQPPVSGEIGSKPLSTSTKSIADQLRDIANGTTTKTTSTSTAATTAPIVITKESAGTIVSVTYSSSSQQYGSGSLQPVGQQTFSSGEAGQPLGTPANTTQRLIQLYTALRDALVRILDILRPFGGSRSSTQYYTVDQLDEHLELD